MIMRSQLSAAGTRICCYHVRAAVVLVALLAVIQGAAGARSSFSTRSLLQVGSCSESSPCPDSSNCCSQYNYCGKGDQYCGKGCKNGPCSPGTGDPTPPSGGGAGWASFFTKAVFEGWFPNRRQSFYSYEAFTAAASAYSAFGTTGSLDDQKREIAAFFGNVQHESEGLEFVEEIGGASRDYCDESNTQYPCAPGKAYYGRGPIQLSYNYNYGEAGQDLHLDLLANPDQVAQNGATAFKTALWFWMKRNCHGAIIGPPLASPRLSESSMEGSSVAMALTIEWRTESRPTRASASHWASTPALTFAAECCNVYKITDSWRL